MNLGRRLASRLGAAALGLCLLVTASAAAPSEQADPSEARNLPAVATDDAIPPPDSDGVGGSVPGQAMAGEVSVKLASFGLGNQARAGEWAGLRFELRDSASKQRNVIVRLTAVDADGDRPRYLRQITSNPGITQGVWLYLRLPFAVEPARDLTVEVFEAIEDDSPAARSGPTPGVREGRLLARQPVAPRSAASLVDPGNGMIGVLGVAKFGLEQYAVQTPRGNYAPLGHEADILVTGLRPSDLPDRWMGLQQYSVLVWGEGEPTELRAERARSVREWVSRGGHLVIVLPNVGESWSNRNSNELFDILPVVTITRTEAIDLEPYRAIFTTDPQPQLPRNGVVYRLNPIEGSAPGEAIRLINGPDGQCIVARRLVGAGAVTLVGLDLARPQFASGKSLNPEILWHRVLGRRGRLSKPDDQATGATAAGLRPLVPLDQDIPREISKAGRSAAGVLLGLVVFAAYWLLAGPLGFMLLKRRGLTRHAWLAFLGVGAIFTVVAWSGATAIRPSRAEASHVTFVDHVYGQAVQRTRTFAALLIPRYGDATVQVGAKDEVASDPLGRRSSNVVSPWEGTQDQQTRTFPDARGYGIDTRGPDTLRVPARATVKEIQADWSGGPQWRMPQPVNADRSAGVLKLGVRGPSQSAESLVEGILVHELPAPLEDVKVIVIVGQRNLPNPGKDVRPPEFTANGSAFVYNSPWPAGEPLDLSLLTRANAATRSSVNLEQTLRAWIEKYDESSVQIPGSGGPDPSRAGERYAALAVFSQLGPPPAETKVGDRTPAVARRTMLHGWDLSRWFTQPCVIIIGSVGAVAAPVESPTPLLLDGEPLPTVGRTLVRWVYPLPDRPPEWRAIDAADPIPPLGSPAPAELPRGVAGDGPG